MGKTHWENQPLEKPSILKRAFDTATAMTMAVATVPVSLLPHAVIGGYDGAIVSGLLLGIAFTAATAMAYKSSFPSYSASYRHMANQNVESCAAASSMAFLMLFG